MITRLRDPKFFRNPPPLGVDARRPRVARDSQETNMRSQRLTRREVGYINARMAYEMSRLLPQARNETMIRNGIVGYDQTTGKVNQNIKLAHDSRLGGLGDLVDVLEMPESKALMNPSPAARPISNSPSFQGNHKLANGGVPSGTRVGSNATTGYNSPNVNSSSVHTYDDMDGMDQGEESGLNPQLLQVLLGEIERQCAKDPSLVGKLHEMLAGMHPDRATEVSKEPSPTNHQAFRQMNSETRKGNPEKRSDPMQPMMTGKQNEQPGMDAALAFDHTSIPGNSTGAIYVQRALLYRVLRATRAKLRRIASDSAIDIAVRTAVRRARREAQVSVLTFEARHPHLV